MPESVTEPKPINKRRGLWWKIPLGALVLLLLTFAIFRLVVHQRVVNHLNAIRDAGYPVTLEELDAWYPEPEGANAADVYQKAFDAYVKDEVLEETLPVLNNYLDLPAAGEPFAEEVARDIESFLVDNAEALALLEEAARIEDCRFPIDMPDGIDTLLPHLRGLRRGAKLLQLRSCMAAERGAYTEATDDCVMLFDIARSLDNEPNAISSLVRISIFRIGFIQAERLIQSGRLSDEMIEQLRRAIDAIQVREATQRAIAGERALAIAIYDDPLKSIRDTSSISHNQKSSPATEAAIMFARRASGLLTLDKAALLDVFAVADGLADLKQWPLDRLEMANDNIPFPYLIARIFSPIPSLIRVPMQVQALRSVYLAGIAAEKYHRDHGELPARLEDLVPTYLDAVPTDPFSKQPLRYRLEEGGAIIYSINYDGTDHGGRNLGDGGGQFDEDTDITFTFGGLQEKLWPVEIVAD